MTSSRTTTKIYIAARFKVKSNPSVDSHPQPIPFSGREQTDYFVSFLLVNIRGYLLTLGQGEERYFADK
jgi:hypothetical protein